MEINMNTVFIMGGRCTYINFNIRLPGESDEQ